MLRACRDRIDSPFRSESEYWASARMVLRDWGRGGLGTLREQLM